MVSIGEVIKKLRKDLRYSQKAFGEMVGISQVAVSKYELGQSEPSFSAINKIAKFAKANKVKIKLLDD